MYELGKKKEVENQINNLVLLDLPFERPISIPHTTVDSVVICGFDRGIYVIMYVCESLEDMQELFDSYAKGMAVNIRWYTGEIPRLEKSAKIESFFDGKLADDTEVGENIFFLLDAPKHVVVSMSVSNIIDGVITGNVYSLGSTRGSGWTKIWASCIGQNPEGEIKDNIFTIRI